MQEDLFIVLLILILLVHVLCVVQWPFATGGGNGKVLAQRLVQINMFHSP